MACTCYACAARERESRLLLGLVLLRARDSRGRWSRRERRERERKKKGIRATVASRGVFSLLCVHFIHECLADRHGENSSCAFPFSRMKGVTMRKIYKNTTYLPRFPRSFQIYIFYLLCYYKYFISCKI